MNKGIWCLEGAEPSNSKVYCLVKLLKAFVCNSFKCKQCGVNSSESRHLTHNSSLSTVHSHAFTLAETLIVMGIIGVVAALTIPNLNSSTNNMEKVTLLKKVYAELDEAYGRAVAKYGPYTTWFNNLDDSLSVERASKRISKFMKIQKYCDNTAIKDCIGEKPWYYMNSENINWAPYTYGAAFVLSNGVVIAVNRNPLYKNCDHSEFNYDNWCGGPYFMIDIDGPNKGAQREGMDIFLFTITKNGVVPYTNYQDGSRCLSSDGVGCTEWVLAKGNMDYLKIDSRKRCPNGQTLTWEKGSCR